MGASVSLYQADQLPAVIEPAVFANLTNNKFALEAYDAFADHNGKISRARMLEIISTTDCYLSHEWGIDKEGRNTGDRVRKIYSYLTSKGFFVPFDEGQICGMSYFDMVKERIQKTQCVILCMTERYFYQLQSPVANATQLEFYECMNKRDHRIVIPLVMEKAAFTIPEFIQKQYPLFTLKTHLDFTLFGDIGADDADMLRDLSLYVSKCIRPLREGGSFRQQRNQFFTTVAGRHYKWLIAHNPKFGHDLAMKYAKLFSDKEIESTSRLWQLLQHDMDFLQKIKIPEKDAVCIRNALKADLQANFDTINTKLIDQRIAAQNQINEDELRGHHERNAVAIDMKVKFTERKLMSREDEFSRNFREDCRMERSHNLYLQGRQQLLNISEHQHAKYQYVLQSMRDLQKQRVVDNDRAWRSEEFLHIGRYTEPAEASGALYRLFIKIDRATVHLLRDEVYLDNPESAECAGDYKENDYLKRERIQAYIERATEKMSAFVPSNEAATDGALVPVDADPEASAEEERNSRLIYLIQEAAYICRAITSICQNNTEHVHEFYEGGVVKLLMALLSQVYLFSCQFESLFMPMSFHYLAMPTEALLAVRYLVKCGIGRRRINTKVGFLFADAGAIELCLEVIRFHLNDMNVASMAIELLFVLIDVPGASATHVKRLMANTNHLVLLIVVMEKYSEYFSPAALNLHSCIIGILSHLILTQQYDSLLRVYRGHLLTPILCTVLPLIDETAEPELCTRLCVSIANIWYRPEYQNSHFFTSEFIPKNDSFAREIAKHVNYRVVLRFLKKILLLHFANDVVVLAAFIALGSICFNSDKIKQEAFKMKLHETVAKVLRDRMGRLDSIHRAAPTSAEYDELHSQQHITREVLFEGLITACNLIIVPPFLTYDTLSPEHGAGLADEILKTSFKDPHTVTAAATGEVKMAAQVTDEPKSALVHFVDAGLAELVMNIVTNYMHDRVLVRSALIFANKFCYRGRYLSTSRLVKLKFCELLLLIMSKYNTDEEIYTLSVMVVTGILSSHPGLIGAAKRLIPAQLCESLTLSMRAQCQQVQASQSRQWMHYSYPYTCRVCVVHCTALYCCLVNNRDYNSDALDRLHKVQFHGMLQCPPPYLLDSLSLESAVVLPGHRSGEPPLTGSFSHKANTTERTVSEVGASGCHGAQLISINNAENVSDDGTGTGDPHGDSQDPAAQLSPESKARYRMITAGVFYNTHSVPETVSRNKESISAGDVLDADYQGCARNVEYLAYMTRKEKDHIMSTLFKIFNVT